MIIKTKFKLLSLRAFIIVICFAGLVPISGLAHPHIFIDTAVKFQFESDKLKGFWVEWLFDEIYTTTIKMDFDKNRDNQFAGDEIQALEKGAFSNLINYNYFTYVTYKGKKHKVKKTNAFWAEIRQNRMFYRFFIPFEVPVSSSNHQIRIAIYDETFYCDIAFLRKKAISVEGAKGLVISHKIKKDQNNVITYDNTYQTAKRKGASYGGLTNPYEVQLRFRRK